jgi:nucleoside-diphosphate-sugar epimerase
MTTLVTGATGFACVHILRALAEAGERVVALDLRAPDEAVQAFVAGVQNRVEFVTGDVLDSGAMLALAEMHSVDRFVHGAAITPTPEIERDDPRRVVDVNVMGTVNLLEAARKVQAVRFVFTSSSGVYSASGSGDRLLSEESPVHAGGLYSICKLASESLLARYKELFGLSTVTGRMASVYGPMERATATRRKPSTIYSLMRACLARKPVLVRGRKFRRTFTRVEDAASIWRELTLADKLEHSVYNVSGGVAYSLEEVLEAFDKADPGFRYSQAPPGQKADVEITAQGERTALDMQRAQSEFGFRPAYSLEQGIESYLQWAREHPLILLAEDQ